MMKRELKWSAMSFALALVCGFSAAPAFGVIIVNSSAPTGAAAVIAQPNGGGDIRDPSYTATSRRAIGSTFNLQGLEPPFALNAITMKLRVGTEAETPIVGSSWVASVFTLSADNDGTPDAYLNAASDKRTAVGTMPALTFSADNFITFVLPFDVSIVGGGQNYGFMVDFASSNANNAISGSNTGWVGSGSNERGDTFGLVQTTNEDSYALWSGGGDDIIFWLGHVEVEEVPEPSSFILAGIGLVGLIRITRHRNRE
jgi:hypothetical protein